MTDETPQASPHSGKLENRFRRQRLIRQIAHGDKSMRQLARDYDCDESAIRQFRDRHATEITDVVEELKQGLDAVWLTSKLERLERMRVELEALDGNESLDAVKLRIDIMRKAAEEIGDIPNKTTLSFEKPVDITLTGIDPGQL